MTFFQLSDSLAQKGRISGKVVNAGTGEVLIGATVTLNDKRSVATDQNGIFSFSGLSDGDYSLTCSYVSFVTKSIGDVSIKEGESVVRDIALQFKSDATAVVIQSKGSSKQAKETVNSLLIAQKNSANVSDGISAETIKKTPDRNTGDILKRVSGATLQENKFAVVRGLNERYNAAFVNGAPLPSSESDRKAFAFDIFPANMLDNLIIYKTATPDMSGEFAGGLIMINTKSIPNENFTSVSFGMGFNTVTTFKDRKFYYGSRVKGGEWEFLGIDNSRKLVQGFPDIASFKAMDITQRIAYSRKFQQRDWGFETKQAFPNSSFQLLTAQNIQRKGRDFIGILFSITHNRNYVRNDGDRTFFAPEYGNAAQRVYEEESHSSQTLFGVIGNVSVKLNNNNNLSLKNLFSVNSEDRVLTRNGQDDIINEANRFTKSHALWFTSNLIYTSQLLGEHYLPESKIKLNWLASLSSIRREIPALRRMVYDSTAGADSTYIAKLFDINPVDNDNTAGLSFYSVTTESIQNFKADISRNFKTITGVQTNIKSGFYYQFRDREFNPRLLAFCNYNATKFNRSFLSLPANEIFDKTIGGQPDGKTGYALKDITEIRDLYTANNRLISYYLMADQRYGKKIRAIFGARLESFRQQLNAKFNQFTPVSINTLKTDLLPSVNTVFSINAKQNLRFSYSKTVNRPEFRELAPFLFRDYSIRYSIFGDTSLRRAVVDNFDLRYEIYPGKAQLFSISGFYKKFLDPIELISVSNVDRTLSYRNTPSASIFGAELEARIMPGNFIAVPESSILNYLTIFTNLTLIKSKVNLNVTDSTNFYYSKGRVMQGQSPYVINAGITYQDDEKNLSSTISLNRYGQRIFLASNGDALQDGTLIEPNLWENGRTQLDFQISKSIPEKRLEIKFNIRDILAQKLVFFEDSNDNRRFDKSDAKRSESRFGRVFSFNITYKL
jgi:hypothetical protein